MMKELQKRPLLIAILSSLVTVIVFHVIHSFDFERVQFIKPKRLVPTTPVAATTFFKTEVVKPAVVKTASKDNSTSSNLNYDARNCKLFKEPVIAKRVPNILETGRVRLVNYKTFPDDPSIECVPHHAASPKTKICIIDPAKDAFISGSLKTRPGWEPHITASFRKALAACPDCDVLDFGSNLGVYALIGATENRRVFAVEPMHENLLRLVKSVRVNKWEERITIITNTLSDVYEEVEFWRPFSNAGGSMARKVGLPPLDPKQYEGPYDKVSSVQIDNLLEVIDIKKAIMKIDIEGYEPRAFSGASRFFAQMDIPVIFMEWSNKGTLPDALKMAMDLAKLGYVVHDPRMVKINQPSAATVKYWPFDIIWKKM